MLAHVRYCALDGLMSDIAPLPLRANSRRTALQQSIDLFDHLVGAGEQLGRHRQLQRPRGFRVDD
jgi:hypothetical protein